MSLCKKLNLYIANSRVGADKGVDAKTCKDVSVVDYLIMSSKLFPFVKEFKIKDYEQLYSDCHYLIHSVVHAWSPSFTTNESTGDSNTEMYMKWNSNRKLDFVNCVQNDNTGILTDVLTDLENLMKSYKMILMKL